MLINILRVDVKRRGPDSFQWCPATGQEVTDTNWSIGSSIWTWGRTSLRVTEHWNRLPRGFVQSPSLETHKTCLDAVLCSLLYVILLWQGGWTRWSPEVPSNPYCSVILWSRVQIYWEEKGKGEGTVLHLFVPLLTIYLRHVPCSCSCYGCFNP